MKKQWRSRGKKRIKRCDVQNEIILYFLILWCRAPRDLRWKNNSLTLCIIIFYCDNVWKNVMSRFRAEQLPSSIVLIGRLIKYSTRPVRPEARRCRWNHFVRFVCPVTPFRWRVKNKWLDFRDLQSSLKTTYLPNWRDGLPP